MVGQAFDLLGQPISRERLQGPDDVRMQRAPPLLQQRLVCHLAGEGVREGVCVVGKESRLVEELGGLQVSEAPGQGVLGQLNDSL